jgi:hypothetical protein
VVMKLERALRAWYSISVFEGPTGNRGYLLATVTRASRSFSLARETRKVIQYCGHEVSMTGVLR